MSITGKMATSLVSGNVVNFFNPFHFHDLITNSLYCLLYNSCDVRAENLALLQLIILQLTFLFILITRLFDIVSMLQEEVLSMELYGLTRNSALKRPG